MTRTPVGYAEDGQAVRLKHYLITQQIARNNGVLISRPQPTDEKILNLIYTHNIHTVEDYSRWLKNNIIYKKDTTHHWATPEETLNLKVGDCEDYALLSTAVLMIMGYQPHFLTIVRDGGAHAICSFEYQGTYMWFDNSQLKKSDRASLAEFAQYISETYNYSHILELNLHSKQWNLVYQKSQS